MGFFSWLFKPLERKVAPELPEITDAKKKDKACRCATRLGDLYKNRRPDEHERTLRRAYQTTLTDLGYPVPLDVSDCKQILESLNKLPEN